MIKPLQWLGRSREIVQNFAKTAKARTGYQLFRVQQGLMPKDYKPMPSVGKGALEIRLHEPHECRVIYVAKFQDKVYVLHAFIKKTQKTSKSDIEIARKHYQELMHRIANLKIKE